MKRILLLILTLGFGTQAYSQCTANTKSIVLNGTSSYVSFTTDSNLQIDSAITVEAWIKPTAFGANNYTNSIFCKHSWTQGEMGYVLRCGASGQLSFNFAGLDSTGTPTSWQNVVSPTSALTLNTWQHVAATYDGDTARLFVNTIQVTAYAFKGSIVPSTSFPAVIGRLSDPGVGASRYFSGQIDEVRVWNRAVSQTELAAGYNRHISPTSPGLAGYWNFNIAAGTSLPDQTSSGNAGTLTSGSLSTNVPFFQGSLTPIISTNGAVLTSTSATTYQWNYNGQPIVTGTNQSYTATQNGTYTVTIVDSIGCPATSAPVIVNGVGIQEISNRNNLVVKNLANSIEIVAMNSTKIESAQIFNSNGSLIAEVENQESTVSFNKSQFAKGIYIINVTTDKGLYQSRVAIQ
jgi:Concanavalin A-like lectin/glucanases superfamily